MKRGSFRPKNSATQADATVWSAITEGMNWFWRHRLLHTLGIKAAWEHGYWAATNAILVLLVQEQLGLDAAAYGVLLSGAAVGGVFGGLVASRVIAHIGPGTAALLNLVLQGVAYLGIALSTNVVVVGLMLATLSYTGSIGGVVGISFRQAIVTDALLGRVTCAFRVYAVGSMALGALAGGALAHTFGLLAPYWISGIALLMLTVVLLPTVNNRTMAQARQEAQSVAEV